MRVIIFRVLYLMVSLLFFNNSFTQSRGHRGTDFWVGYGLHQFMSPGNDNSQNMVLYFATGDTAATVTVKIEGSGIGQPPSGGPWTKVYTMPPNTVISIEDPLPAGVAITKSPFCLSAIGTIPKGLPTDCGFDARLLGVSLPTGTGSEQIFTKKGIHITSTAPIAAFAHIYGSVSSGATMLIPTNAWGYGYTSINSEQNNATDANSWMYVIANHDSTVVRITPSVPTVGNRLPGVSFDITLNYGEIYQLLGKLYPPFMDEGYNLTGTTVQSIPNVVGNSYPVAAFAGSGRTGGEPPCNAGGRDNDIQQLFPEQAWGKHYLLAPYSNSTTPSSFMQCIYKVVLSDTTTVVLKNGVPLTGLLMGKYYKYTSTTADYIEADKPIMVAQFIGGGCVSMDGDPEMVYPSPLEQRLRRTRFYRNDKQGISTQYVTIVIPTNGLNSLTIDSILFSAIPSSLKFSYPHPNLPGYSVAIRKWAAEKKQCIIQSDSAYTGITYGLGGAESYGYNIGSGIDSIGPDGRVLPVSLVSISALKSIKNIIVNWKTINELNTDHYEIERSLDGINFARAGTILSKGNSMNGYSYVFTDKDVVKTYSYKKALYYRLHMVDRDGSKKYSTIKKVALDKNESFSISVSPVPFKDKISVVVNTVGESTALIAVNDLTGRTILTQNALVVAGNNTITINDLDKLVKGIYVLSVTTNGDTIRLKIVK